MPFRPRPLLLLTLGALFSGLTATTQAAPAKSAASPTAHVIVQWKVLPTAAQRRRVQALGVSADRPLTLIHADALRLPMAAVPRLRALPFVRHVSPDVSCRKNDEYTVGASGADVAFADAGLSGTGVAVAVLDSGIQAERADIAGRTLASVSFVGENAGEDAGDECGHGTHIAGIIAGSGAASSGPDFFRTFYGIARGANLVNVRVLDASGQGAVSDVIAGLGWTVAHKDEYGIRVINLSLGHPVGESCATDPLCQAVEAAYRAGLVVVCAAGNGGRLWDTPRTLLGIVVGSNEGYGTVYGSIQSPANDPYVITVGAMKSVDGLREHDQIATYSSRGPSRLDFVMKPDLVAPGNRIISVNAVGSALEANVGAIDGVDLSEYSTLSTPPGDRYLRLSGTSMAAPVVAGAAALLLQADPTLSPDTVKARLMIAADKTGYGQSGQGDTNPLACGAGYLDIPAALACPYTATAPALSPTVACDETGTLTISDSPLLASGQGVWGTGLLDLAGVWGAQILWGDNTLSASQIVWGDSAKSTLWNRQIVWGDGTPGDSTSRGNTSSGSAATDLSATALLGDPDKFTPGPLSFLMPPPVPSSVSTPAAPLAQPALSAKRKNTPWMP